MQRASDHLHADGSRVLTHVFPQSCCLPPAYGCELSIYMVHAQIVKPLSVPDEVDNLQAGAGQAGVLPQVQLPLTAASC